MSPTRRLGFIVGLVAGIFAGCGRMDLAVDLALASARSRVVTSQCGCGESACAALRPADSQALALAGVADGLPVPLAPAPSSPLPAGVGGGLGSVPLRPGPLPASGSMPGTVGMSGGHALAPAGTTRSAATAKFAGGLSSLVAKPTAADIGYAPSADQRECLGRRLQSLRADRGLNLKQAADGSGVDDSFLGALETARKGVDPSSLRKIAAFYHVTVESLAVLIAPPRGETLATRVLYHRKVRALTQLELARATGDVLTVTDISLIEGGKMLPSERDLEILCGALGQTTGELLGVTPVESITDTRQNFRKRPARVPDAMKAKDPLAERLGAQVLALRKAFGWSQAALARAVERESQEPCGQSDISRYESGLTLPRPYRLKALAGLFAARGNLLDLVAPRGTTFRERLLHYRLVRGMTQQELADAAGYKHNSSIAEYETGTREPTPEAASKLAAGLGISAEELSGEIP